MRSAWEWAERHKLLTVFAVMVVATIVINVAGMSAAPAAAPATQSVVAPSPTPAPAISSTEAASQFKELMDMSAKATLVSSYEFTDTDRVIYVSDVWYSMTVQFKKDFLAKVAMLQDAISGKHFFEVRDEHSNETVGEVTAFSGSLEVYK
jgi:hypothetical protein